MLYEFRRAVIVGTAQKNIEDIYLDRATAFQTVVWQIKKNRVIEKTTEMHIPK